MVSFVIVTFSVVALICVIICSYWILKLRENILLESQNIYSLCAIVSIGFLISFPLWILFNEFFNFVSLTISKVSYLLFSVGYFGILLVCYLAVAEVENVKEFAKKAKESTNDKNLLRKVKELEIANADLERFQKFAVGRELRMIELKKEIERLKAKKKK